MSGWQLEKCQIYRQSWDRALDFFGSDNLNHNFIAQNENFTASGCTAQLPVCPQSSQELAIANAMTIELMNAGTASTFPPFRCQTIPTPHWTLSPADRSSIRSMRREN